MNSDNKIISLEEALSFIKSSDHVVTGLEQVKQNYF